MKIQGVQCDNCGKQSMGQIGTPVNWITIDTKRNEHKFTIAINKNSEIKKQDGIRLDFCNSICLKEYTDKI